MLSFNNTEIAFANKTNNDLNQSYWLFKIMSNNTVVSIGNQLIYAALKLHLPIKNIIQATIFKQFCGGETIEECDKKIKLLSVSNIGTILDYSVEGKKTEADFQVCVNETIKTIYKSKNNKHIPFCVFKVTGLARFELLEKVSAKITLNNHEQQEYECIYNNVNVICKAAFEADVAIFIDAEESWIQNAIDDLANMMMMMYNKQKPIVYTTFQMYRKDRLDYLKNSFAKAEKENYLLGVKLVRGAYMRKERTRAIELNYSSPIHDTKEATDNDYNAALLYCLSNIQKIAFCAATHNENSLIYLAQLIEEKTIQKNNSHIFFAQL